jgi:heme oxygenase (mycobilin-producing)
MASSRGEDMTTNRVDADAITLVNVFEIESEKLESFLAVWDDRAEFLRQQPGFRSLRLLRAVSEGAQFRAVTIIEWDDIDTARAATSQEWFELGARLAVDEFGVVAHPGVYRQALIVSSL